MDAALDAGLIGVDLPERLLEVKGRLERLPTRWQAPSSFTKSLSRESRLQELAAAEGQPSHA